ncbi:hypothetical protein [Gracilibacillus dipsosauri]|uniref:hypothetical protein n=1 Tax=Gracilibacillus dipsosauri TaxID=178340 RepID=UPI00240910D1
MENKKVDLYFGDCLARFEIELHDYDCFSVCLTEYQKNEEKSTDNNDFYEERFTTEVFVGEKELKSIIRAMQFMVIENNSDES